tara:strand:- start:118 stop:594 length:477 start_codon:yes stop_codon:yes gene_type:complete
MKKILFLIITTLFISNCSLNKVIKVHGVNYLEKKHKEIIVNKSNKNDIIKVLGPPSTKSSFNDNLFIYIERRTSSSKISRLGKKTLLTNNVLILELDNRGILSNKIFLDKEKMQDLKFSEDLTGISYRNNSVVRDLLSGLMNKINDPLGKKRRKLKRD